MKKLVVLFSLALIAILAVILYPFMAYSRPDWPKIADPAQLIEDCQGLMKVESNRVLPESLWPASIRSLHPRAIIVTAKENIEIVIDQGGISTRASYIIPAKNSGPQSFSSPGMELHPTKHPGIFKAF